MAEKSKKIVNMEGKKELLKPKYDVVFQSLFSDKNRKETGYLISAILGQKIEVIEVRTEVSEFRELSDEKIGRLDLVAKTASDELVHIEIQLVDYKNTIPRLLYSQNQKIAKQLKRGDRYKDLKRTITIGLINYELKELEDIEEMHTIWNFREQEHKEKVLTYLQELHIIEMPKAEKEYKRNPGNKLAQWIMFILNPNGMEVMSIMSENEEIKETSDKLEGISENEHLRKKMEMLERWELEEQWNRHSIQEYGKQLGKAEGEAIGAQNQKVEIAKQMLKENLEIDLIAKVTGLTKEEIEALDKK
jgi:predicted transposase/invertase (TIGR01784 family)